MTIPSVADTAGNVNDPCDVNSSVWNTVPVPGGVKTSALPPITVCASIAYNLGAGVDTTSSNVPAAILTVIVPLAVLRVGVASDSLYLKSLVGPL